MANCDSPDLKAAVEDIRDNSTPTDWACFGYEGKTKIKLVGTGSDGLDGFRKTLVDNEALYGFIRMTSGDQESKRAKFCFVVWAGASLGALSRSRLTTHKPSLISMIGVPHFLSLFFLIEA